VKIWKDKKGKCKVSYLDNSLAAERISPAAGDMIPPSSDIHCRRTFRQSHKLET